MPNPDQTFSFTFKFLADGLSNISTALKDQASQITAVSSQVSDAVETQTKAVQGMFDAWVLEASAKRQIIDINAQAAQSEEELAAQRQRYADQQARFAAQAKITGEEQAAIDAKRVTERAAAVAELEALDTEAAEAAAKAAAEEQAAKERAAAAAAKVAAEEEKAAERQSMAAAQAVNSLALLGSGLGLLPNAAFQVAFGFQAATQAAEAFGIGIGTLTLALTPILGILVALKGAGELFGFAKESVGDAANLESMTVRMAGVLGSMDEARKRLEELRQTSSSTGVPLQDLATASEKLQLLTNGELAAGQGLKLIVDIAAQTGKSVGEIATPIGRMYAAIYSGQDATRAVRQLELLGIISTDDAAKIGELSKQVKAGGMQAADAWQQVEDSLGRFSGAADAQANTWNGLMSRIKADWEQVKQDFGTPVKNALQATLGQVEARIKSLDSTVKTFGNALAYSIVTGDWKSAWDYVVTSFKVSFEKGIASLTNDLRDKLTAATKAAAESNAKQTNQTPWISSWWGTEKARMRYWWTGDEPGLLPSGASNKPSTGPSSATADSNAGTGELSDPGFAKLSDDEIKLQVLKLKFDQAAEQQQKTVDQNTTPPKAEAVENDNTGGITDPGAPMKQAQARDYETEATTKLRAAEQEYQTTLQKTNVLKQSGAITSAQAQEQDSAATAQYIANLRAIQNELPAIIALLKQKAAAEKDPSKQTKDQDSITRLASMYDQLGAKIDQAKYKMSDATFWGHMGNQVTALMQQWIDLRTTVTEFATNTLQTTLEAASQALGDLIFRTGNWQQSFAEAARSIIQDIIRIVLQFTIGRATMALLNRVFGAQDQAAATTTASAAASAWAPAAISASIASYGTAAGTGTAAYLAALTSGVAASVTASEVGNAFMAGGYTGDGGVNEVAGIVHRGEYVIPANRTAQYRGLLEDMHAGRLVTAPVTSGRSAQRFGGSAARSGAGGGNGGTAGHKIVVVHDKRELYREMARDPEFGDAVVAHTKKRRNEMGIKG